MGDSSDATPVAEVSQAPKALKAPEISVKDGATDVSLVEPITVTSQGEGLAKVTMVNEEGREIESTLSADGMTWTTDEDLGLSRTYTVTAKDENGKTATATFSTPFPAATSGAYLSPLPDSTVGVGQAIGFRFETAVEDRQAVQDAIEIETSNDTEGAFYWISPYEVRWRPAEYWEPGTEVSVTANFYGLDLGGGVYGTTDAETNFTIGDRVMAIVDDATKQMTVWRNHELLRTIPVSMGMDNPDFYTPNGIYTIGDEHQSLVMDSETFGLAHEAGGYRTKVNYATQMSYSGIYVHGAPWSVWAQGNTNTSHGCINMTEEAAAWFQDTVKRGDIVKVVNTKGGTLPYYDGLGDWNMSWEEWSAGNADQP